MNSELECYIAQTQYSHKLMKIVLLMLATGASVDKIRQFITEFQGEVKYEI